MDAFTIRVPCSSANLGPGFDVMGLALTLYLTLEVTVDPSDAEPAPLNCRITYADDDTATEEIPLDPDANLIGQSALYVLRCHDQRAFPKGTRVLVKNSIPLSRGLGSSASAVVAGVTLGNEVGKLGLSKDRLLDYCLMIERHPDNVAAALFGGFVGTYLNALPAEDLARKEIPLAEVLPAPAGGVDTGFRPPDPPVGIGHYRKFPWAPEIKAVAVIPDFAVPTAKAREVLPDSYKRADLVFNLQRTALLPIALGQSPPHAETIFLAMQDKLHQPYRQALIPGLADILQSINPASQPGFLGVCLSGAGPTILALATSNCKAIADRLVAHFTARNIKCDWELLEPAQEGAVVIRK